MDAVIVATLLIVGTATLYLATSYLSRNFRIAAHALIIIIAILAIMTLIVFNDLQKLRSDITGGQNSFILYDGGKAYAAVQLKPVQSGIFDFDSFNYFTTEELETFGEEISRGEVPSSNSSRAFIFSTKALNRSYDLDLGLKLDENDLLAVAKSNDSFQALAQILKGEREITKEYLQRSYREESVLKGYIVAALAINYFRQNAGQISPNIKSGDLRIMPESISIKMLRYLPLPDFG